MQRNGAFRASDWPQYQYLREAVAGQLLERIRDINRSFPAAAELGAGAGSLLSAWRGEGGVTTWYQCDMAEVALARGRESLAASRGAVQHGIVEILDPHWQSDSSQQQEQHVPPGAADEDDEDMRALQAAGAISNGGGSSESTVSVAKGSTAQVLRVCCDEEHLPLRPGSLDLVVSVLNLQWCNDIEDVLKQVRRALKPDGVFVAAVLGGDTATELRTSLVAAEMERRGGVGLRASPMMHVADAGSLLQASGFAIPTIDTSFIQVEYDSAVDAMMHLHGMGEAAAPATAAAAVDSSESVPTGTGGLRHADVLLSAAAFYQWTHGGTALDATTTAGDVDLRTTGLSDPRSRRVETEGLSTEAFAQLAAQRLSSPVPLTYQIIWMIGWAPAPTQSRPLARGSVPKGLRAKDTPRDS